ncbi:hypothetical protein [Providencia sp. PROV261]|uniref:hypothetical protein n=1 Tax=Providencia sp. PROV261 TaxID=2949949 RepID=UPI00234C01B0|nr:hypothetical protein [Providencia sp. PROV261]
MKNLQMWIDTFSEIHEEKQLPFNTHFAKKQLSEDECQIYTIFHAAVLLADGVITDEQRRLYKFWLPSISDNTSLSELLQSASNFSPEDLKIAINIIEKDNLSIHFILDTLVFCYVSGGINHAQKEIINEIINILNITEKDFNDIIKATQSVLGIRNEEKVFIEENSIINSLSQSLWTEFSVGNIFLKNEISIIINTKKSTINSGLMVFMYPDFKLIVNEGDIVHSGEVIAINKNNKNDKISSTFSGYITAITPNDRYSEIQFKYHPIII